MGPFIISVDKVANEHARKAPCDRQPKLAITSQPTLIERGTFYFMAYSHQSDIVI